MPITLRPGTVAMRTAVTDRLRATSSASPITRALRMPGRRLQLVERDHRTRPDLDDAALHAIVRQHRLQQPRIGLQGLFARAR